MSEDMILLDTPTKSKDELKEEAQDDEGFGDYHTKLKDGRVWDSWFSADFLKELEKINGLGYRDNK